MKKINILLLTLAISVTAFSQTSFNPFNLNEKKQKGLVSRSTLIIEGKLIKGKDKVFDNNSKRGYFYCLGVIKPTAILKGNTDTSKTYQVFIKLGEYVFDFNEETGVYGPGFTLDPDEDGRGIPGSGIYFLNENPAPVTNSFRQVINGTFVAVDLYSLFPNAKMAGFNYGIQYNKKNSKEQTLKYLQEKHNLVATPLK